MIPDNTVYPFFWVSPVRKISLNPELADSGHYCEGCNWDDADAIYGVYRYDKPDETGISVATWIVDCDDLETADAITGAMNHARTMIALSPCISDDLANAKKLIYPTE